MTTIASLGLQIDSGDAVEAKDNLDQLTDAGKRTEELAGRTGRAWETALGSLQGDTRQIVQELQSLNAKQAELAQQMATVGRAVTSASTAFSSAAANMGAFRTEAAQAGKVQETLTSATDAGAQAGRRAAESADEQQARILAVAKASMEASQYVQSLNRLGRNDRGDAGSPTPISADDNDDEDENVAPTEPLARWFTAPLSALMPPTLAICWPIACECECECECDCSGTA